MREKKGGWQYGVTEMAGSRERRGKWAVHRSAKVVAHSRGREESGRKRREVVARAACWLR
ncbi:hypothetical protein AMTR_s00098p00137750 [Amborella trichopoda]|uniref:Uncharacterized protein n=1 Tax=Amborella trichopoda TaxID=13333 RepID=W1NYT7_AMBTC|nr:hypothetical protein AMTR_s00098p00137750 [Amborella trichopoda]